MLLFVLLVERKQPTSDEAQATEAPTEIPVILYLETDQVRALRVARTGSGERTELVRGTDGLWQFTAPRGRGRGPGPSGVRLESLAFLQPSREISGTVALADYGLEPPVTTVIIEMADGATHSVRLGETNPSQSGYYAQVDEQPSVFLIPAYTGSELERLLTEPPVQPTPTPTAAEIATPTATP